MVDGVFTPYSTVSGFVNAYAGWIPELDRERIGSYQTYEEIYWNHPETFKLVVRGTETEKPIYLPSGRVIVETMNRYLCKGFTFAALPLAGTTAGAEQQMAKLFIEAFWRRERIRSQFTSNKRYGIMRGDWLFHIMADPNKPEGSRISLRCVDPGSYFPVYDDDDLDKLIKVHLAEEFVDNEGKSHIRRQTYEKIPSATPGGLPTIMSSQAILEPDKWTGTVVEQMIFPPTPLPPEITAIPVYLIKNFEQPQNPFGSSEMRGLERIMAAMNQSVNDEDIALALEGLGVYTTDGGGPVNDEGEETDWVIGPGRVIENAAGFKRVQGVGSVQPFGDHMNFLWDFLKMASNTPDSAVGKIDVQVAESGVARLMELAPILAKAEEKQEIAADTLTQMMYDWRAWFKAYEGIGMESTQLLPVFGDPLPANRKAEVDLVLAMVAAKIMSAATARAYLTKINAGFDFAADEDALISSATASEAAAVDPYAARLGDEA